MSIVRCCNFSEANYDERYVRTYEQWRFHFDACCWGEPFFSCQGHVVHTLVKLFWPHQISDVSDLLSWLLFYVGFSNRWHFFLCVRSQSNLGNALMSHHWRKECKNLVWWIEVYVRKQHYIISDIISLCIETLVRNITSYPLCELHATAMINGWESV